MKRLALAMVLALYGCGGPSASPAAWTTAAPNQLEVDVRDFKIEPSQITVAPPFEVAVVSSGPTPHNFTIRDSAGSIVVASHDLRAGESDTVEVRQLAAGDYTFFCSFAGHESLGMRGTLTLTE